MNDRYAITMGVGGTARADELILEDGTRLVLRRVRADDEPHMAPFHAGLSSRSVYQQHAGFVVRPVPGDAALLRAELGLD